MTKDGAKKAGFLIPDKNFSLINEGVLPYPDNLFSAIIDRESLSQSSWAEIKSRVTEFKRVLQPGGWYLGVNFSCHQPDLRFADSIGNGDYINFRKGSFAGQGRRHFFSVNEILELFFKWNIDNLSELKTTSIIGNNEQIETSEYVIAAQNIKDA
jgi:hypothetical protein